MGMRDERPDVDASADSGLDSSLDLSHVEAKNDEVERFRRRIDGVEEGLEAVLGLNDQIQRVTTGLSPAVGRSMCLDYAYGEDSKDAAVSLS
jgi:hypothetical protein